ncbi:STAS/SEC14 domain-containing protein [Hugenholtzia roseola]|uniref:STAS/SEC14 domain-containing protein n=1 Tax=Hugenholtzia roseola TaxID=1002 RepID=UPI00047C67BC|nr:STAS/SEC14 domain-containing protein [Hugenholtzia roseola]
MQVYKSKYKKIDFHQAESVMEVTWLPQTADMSAQEYQEEMLNYIEIARKYKPLYALPNTAELFFTITPEIQQWMNAQIFPVFAQIGMRAAAFVVSQDIFAQLSIEQTMEEEVGQRFQSRYFVNTEEAMNWLQSFSKNLN